MEQKAALRYSYNVLLGDLGHRVIRALEFDRFQTLATKKRRDIQHHPEQSTPFRLLASPL
jgi:hypothetical protein